MSISLSSSSSLLSLLRLRRLCVRLSPVLPASPTLLFDDDVKNDVKNETTNSLESKNTTTRRKRKTMIDSERSSSLSLSFEHQLRLMHALREDFPKNGRHQSSLQNPPKPLLAALPFSFFLSFFRRGNPEDVKNERDAHLMMMMRIDDDNDAARERRTKRRCCQIAPPSLL